MSISKDEADYLRDLCRQRKVEIEQWRQQQKEDYQTYLDKVRELEGRIAEAQTILKQAIDELCEKRYVGCEFKIKEAQETLSPKATSKEPPK